MLRMYNVEPFQRAPLMLKTTVLDINIFLYLSSHECNGSRAKKVTQERRHVYLQRKCKYIDISKVKSIAYYSNCVHLSLV